ncbi:MAG: septum formation initiator family protein [Aerococcus sp.]|nr:septum formation initiator family protein [Aerococcus sp.]
MKKEARQSHNPKLHHYLPGEANHKKRQKAPTSARQTLHDMVLILLSGAFIFSAVAFLGMSVYTHFETEAVVNEKTLAASELENEQHLLKNLQQQTERLKDNDYVLKLARSRYYLSKEGEIIFSVPEDNDSKQAKALNKAYKTASEESQNKTNQEDQ